MPGSPRAQPVLWHPTALPINLRWVILHLIEETSRHNGHLDVVRELVDGRTCA
ncbi:MULTISPECIES: mycothiol transferase [Streptomyces]|uniref:mycothiol transferase n=1 Tax=Streptomyces TaxID=1883 RepID=UPI003864F4A8